MIQEPDENEDQALGDGPISPLPKPKKDRSVIAFVGFVIALGLVALIAHSCSTPY